MIFYKIPGKIYLIRRKKEAVLQVHIYNQSNDYLNRFIFSSKENYNSLRTMNSQKKKEKVIATNRSDHPINHSQEGEFGRFRYDDCKRSNCLEFRFRSEFLISIFLTLLIKLY